MAPSEYRFLLLLFGIFLSSIFAPPRATAAAVLHPRQYWPDPTKEPIPSEEKCIEESFSSPKWGIYDPALITVNGSSGGSMGDIRFLTMNTASGVVANCTANNIDLDPKGPGAADFWHNCSIPDLYFQFNLTSFELRVKGSWSCGKSKLVFAAAGTWEEPLIQGCLDDWEAPRGEEILCIMGNSQVWGVLSQPVKIVPQLPLLPYTPSQLYPRCVDRSIDPGWEVSNFLYRHHHATTTTSTTTRTGQGEQEEQGTTLEKHYHLTFDLLNTSTDEKVACNVTVDQRGGLTNKDGSTSWVDCGNNSGNNNNNNPKSNTTSTLIMLDTVNGLLGVKQSWNCTDAFEGIERNDFTGTAYLKTDLECGTPLDQATRDPQGNVIGATSDYNCTLRLNSSSSSSSPPPPDTVISFSGYSADYLPVMPHTRYTRSCTIGSVLNTTSLNLREYEIEVMDGGSVGKVGTFSLFNPGSGDTYRLHRIPVVDDGAWHDCLGSTTTNSSSNRGGNLLFPWQLVKCRYLLDREKHHVGFQVQWYCDDRDPSHAILFEATASTKTALPAEKCDDDAKSESCRLPLGDIAGGGDEVVIPVSSLTWTSTPGPMDRGPTLPWV